MTFLGVCFSFYDFHLCTSGSLLCSWDIEYCRIIEISKIIGQETFFAV